MKSSVKKISAVSLIFLFSALGFSQDTITITLIVDTGNFDPDNWLKSCRLEYTPPGTEKVVESDSDALECFLVQADVDDLIIWEGRSSEPNSGTVDIKKIKRAKRKGTEIFKNRSLCYKRRSGFKKGTLQATVLEDTKDKNDYKYNLSFKINDTSRTYIIDPKMRIMRR